MLLEEKKSDVKILKHELAPKMVFLGLEILTNAMIDPMQIVEVQRRPRPMMDSEISSLRLAHFYCQKTLYFTA